MNTKPLPLAREIKELTDMDRHDIAIMLEGMRQGESDIQPHDSDWRFIHQKNIDEIQAQELGSDEYILGCFNAPFLADVLDIDQDVIEAMQKAEAFEAVGKLIISMGKLEKLQQDYVSADGYGHHFAHYDHEEHEIGDYYAFRIN